MWRHPLPSNACRVEKTGMSLREHPRPGAGKVDAWA